MKPHSNHHGDELSITQKEKCMFLFHAVSRRHFFFGQCCARHNDCGSHEDMLNWSSVDNSIAQIGQWTKRKQQQSKFREDRHAQHGHHFAFEPSYCHQVVVFRFGHSQVVMYLENDGTRESLIKMKEESLILVTLSFRTQLYLRSKFLLSLFSKSSNIVQRCCEVIPRLLKGSCGCWMISPCCMSFA